jgi:hypothetical protein
MVIEQRNAAEFKPQFVLIPADELPGPRDDSSVVNPKACIPLHLDSRDNEGYLYTAEQWASGAESTLHRDHSGEITGLENGDEVSLIPDLAIVKLREREYWSDEIQAQTKEIWGVYAIDLRQHHHICSITPNYEARYLCTQYDEIDGLTEEQQEKLSSDILQGAAFNDEYSYFETHYIDRVLQNVCREHFHPENGRSGGYKIDTGMVRTVDAHNWAVEFAATNYA